MKTYTAKEIRNIALVGHGGDGKTTLTEAWLFYSGMIDRQGKTEDGNTASDFDQEEINRKISISVSVFAIEGDSVKINLVDTPGYFDFAGEACAAYHLADTAVVVLSGSGKLTVGAEKAYKLAKKNKVARAFLINGMDKENASFNKVFSEIKTAYGTTVTALQLPIGEAADFRGYVDIMSKKAYLFDGKGEKETEIPADMAAMVDEYYGTLCENAAENDESLMEKYFAGEELNADDVFKGVKIGIATGSIVPVLVASAVKCQGIAGFKRIAENVFPCPTDMGEIKAKNIKSGEEVMLQCNDSLPFAAQVVKTIADPFVGKISIFKIAQGTLAADKPLYNSREGKSEKISGLLIMKGKKQVNVDKLCAGDIGAIAKLAFTQTGDTLSDASSPVELPAIEFPKPCISLAVVAKKQGEEDKVFSGLYKFAEEDPTFRIAKSPDTPDTLMSGLGELHLDVILKKLLNKYKVDAELLDPQIPYRETIKKKIAAQGRHKKQSGGHGQFGDVWIEFEPVFEGDSFQFVDKVVGGSVPRNFIPAVEKGLRESVVKGVIAGYPMVNIKCTLYDGSYHPVDSSEMAFKVAASLAYKKACAEANPVLLEPIGKVSVRVPDQYMGDVIGDLNKKRGRILGMGPSEDGQMVEAEVPMAEMFKYATDLRSMTHSRGSFEIVFERYDELPAQLAAKVIEKAKKDEEEK